LALGIVDILQVNEVTARTTGAVLALLLCGTYCNGGNFFSEYSGKVHGDVRQGWWSLQKLTLV